MIVDPALAEAHFHRPAHRVLARTLNGFAPKHWLALDWLENPWASGREGDFADLVEAANICAARNDEELDIALHPSFWPAAHADMVARQLRLCRDVEGLAAAEAARFGDYLADYWSPPPIDDTGEGARGGEVPASHPASILVARAVAELGMSRAEAWWHPGIGALQWDLLAARELATGKAAKLRDAAFKERARRMGWDID